MTQEALKMALEALENSVDLVVEDAYNAEKLYGNYPTRQGKVGGLKILADQHKEAITAIKEALRENAMREVQRLGQEIEQEPVAWMWMLDGEVWDLCSTKDRFTPLREGHVQVPLYTTPPQRTDQEQQIETLKRCLFQMQEAAKDLVKQAKSLTPPQRTWVGLTDEDIAQGCKESWVTELAFQSAVWWAEAKLKQKNGYAEEKNND